MDQEVIGGEGRRKDRELDLVGRPNEGGHEPGWGQGLGPQWEPYLARGSLLSGPRWEIRLVRRTSGFAAPQNYS
jgi:hypothetical protein